MKTTEVLGICASSEYFDKLLKAALVFKLSYSGKPVWCRHTIYNVVETTGQHYVL